MQHTLEDIFLELNFFFKLSHFTAESQKWLFKFVSIVYDFEGNDLAGLLFEFNQTQLWVLVLEQYLSTSKLQLPIKLLLCLNLVFLRVEYAVETVNVLSGLYLLDLGLAVLIYFEKLVYLLVKTLQNSLHLRFALL